MHRCLWQRCGDVMLDQVTLNGIGCLSGIVGNSNGDVHIVNLSKLSTPQDESFTDGTIRTDGLIQVVDVHIGNIKVTGMKAAQQTFQFVQVVDAVLLGVNQTDAIVYIICQMAAVFDTNDITACTLDCLVDSVNQLLGLPEPFRPIITWIMEIPPLLIADIAVR